MINDQEAFTLSFGSFFFVHCGGSLTCDSCLVPRFFLPLTPLNKILSTNSDGTFSFHSLELGEDLKIKNQNSP